MKKTIILLLLVFATANLKTQTSQDLRSGPMVGYSDMTEVMIWVQTPRGPEVDNPYRMPGTLVNDKHNFGLIRVSGPRTDRMMTLECRDVTGAIRWTHDVRANHLRPPR